jgi:SpoVK/Ycf46/Vps4 family AAA+-type ATPase
MKPAFSSSVDHLLAELERIDLLIRARIAHLRRAQAEDEHFRGLYISEQEVDELLRKPLGEPQWLSAVEPGRWADISAALGALDTTIQARKTESLARGVELRLETLRQDFALERFEIDTLLVCMAAELDLRYEKLYAYLQDDVTRKRPTVDLVLNLLTPSPAAHLAARRHFLPDSALCRGRLIELMEDPAQPHPTLLSRGIKPDDRIVQYLLGSDALDARLRPFAELLEPRAGLDALMLDDDWRRGLKTLLPGEGGAPAPVVHLTGPAGVGKQSVAAALCHEQGLKLLVVSMERLLPDPLTGLAASLRLVDREAGLQRAAVFFKGVDALQGEPQRAAMAVFREALTNGEVTCFLAGEDTWENTSSPCARRYVHVAVPRPSAAHRLRMWQREMQSVRAGPAIDTASVASRFKLTFGQVEDSAATARSLARMRDTTSHQVTTGDVFEACRLNSNRRLGSLARKIVPRYKWDDIVLPPDRVAQLREICNHMKYRDRVYVDWGFGRKLALGKGLMVLFAGPSGTGKTMAADVIAGELGLDLYKIDLSSVVSKYIGETEKNLARIFTEAETSNAILFFDEADALFGKRSEVKDSHDRYANIEVGYLLQRMEEYEGVAILATNFRKNMDEAFVRRLHFTLDMPFPDVAGRHRIWQGIWPKDTPRDLDLDLAVLAERFEMTGGNIRNVALAAAFLAADEGQVVCMSHLIHATQREYQKTGKLMRDQDFMEQGRP